MISEPKVKSYLEMIAEQYPKSVIKSLKQGSLVQKSGGSSYEIDDLDLDRKLGNFPEGFMPYGPIHRALRSSFSGIFALFNDSVVIPFSRAYAARIGECLEKAILVQLSAQRARNSFLIIGCLEEVGDCSSHHAFNVYQKTQNSEQNFVPFVYTKGLNFYENLCPLV